MKCAACAVTVMIAAMVLAPDTALARVERFAVIVGNNRGAADEAPLRYAESDAERVYDVLLQIGDVSPVNAVLLRGKDAATVRSALLQINERIRDATSAPDTQVVLLVYYSGHADAGALHLGGTELPITELRQMARGSAANFRLVVLDACRSGALTRVKGGRRGPPFALPPAQEALPGDGFAFLTASSAQEDAQESDELKGAFFTHAFVTGLLGAADADRDGAVVLDEAYRYAYEATLRATSRTLAGTQHPTFHYDLRGRGRLVLTRPRAHAAQRASVHLPTGHGFLLMRGGEEGPVVLELAPFSGQRTLSLESGRYFVRARGADVMYEGEIEARPGSSLAVNVAGMERIEYARLVRKGGRASRFAHGFQAGVSVRSPLPNADTPCVGAFAGYSLDWSQFGARARFATCTSELRNRLLHATVQAHDLKVDVYHAWDVAPATLELGVGPGLSLFHQRFETRGTAPSRLSAAPFLGIGAALQLGLPHGLYARADLQGETHFVRVIDHMQAAAELNVGFALRTSVGLGKQF